MVEVLATALASPASFLIWPPAIPLKKPPPGPSRSTDFELASRTGDCSLDQPTRRGTPAKLAEAWRTPRALDSLAAQVRRTLEDPRSKRLTEAFVDQRLGPGTDQGVTAADSALKDAMLEEPIAMFQEVLKHDGSIMDFIDCDYAMLNERLASHYQIS